MDAAASPAAGRAAASAAGEIPEDAAAIMRLLKDMDVFDHEPRVVQQLLDFAYRYISDVLQDAHALSTQVGNRQGTIDADDIRQAIQARSATSFIEMPSQETLAVVAEGINKLPFMPEPKARPGLRMPPEADRLTGPSYHYALPPE